MKKSRFSDQQIAFALQQAETGASVADVCRKLSIKLVQISKADQNAIVSLLRWYKKAVRPPRESRALHGWLKYQEKISTGP
jgi:transposase-like protein